jgi:adenine phosphoribosyltransferase
VVKFFVALLEDARSTQYTSAMLLDLKTLIREIPNFPKPGILFRDITPLLADPSGLALSIELMANPFRGKNIGMVIGAESRGFIFGTAVACCLSAGFGLVRKPGKLPHTRISKTYDLEYGTDTLEIHSDAIVRGQRVLLVDDVLATGGTMKACVELVEHLGGELVGIAVLIELAGLNGRDKVAPYPVHSVLHYL